MSRFKLEENGAVLIDGEDILVLGPIEMDLKSRDPFRFNGVVSSGKATFRILGSMTESTYPGGGDWSEIRRFSASSLEGVAFVEQEYPYVVVLASQTVDGEDAAVQARIGHLIGGDIDDFNPLAIAGEFIPGRHVDDSLFTHRNVRKDWTDIWGGGDERIIHNTPAVSEIRSYNAQDGFGGTGATLAGVIGIADIAGVWTLITEVVPLTANGTAYTTNQFIFMNKAFLFCGTNGKNHDNIEFYHGTNTDIQLVISPDDGNISHASHYLVPDNQRAYLAQLTLMGSRNREFEIEVTALYPSVGTWVSSHPMLLYDSILVEKNISINTFDPRTYIKLRGRNRTGGKGQISGRYEIILEDLP